MKTITISTAKCFRFIPEYRILKYLTIPRNESITKLSKNVGCTYGTTLRYINNFKEIGLITVVGKDGRSKRVELTKRGREIGKRLIEIDEIFKGRSPPRDWRW